ncbi:porin family protein [Spirosoma pulveris]
MKRSSLVKSILVVDFITSICSAQTITNDTLLSAVDTVHTTEPAKLKRSWVNVRGGVVIPDFYRRSADAVRSPVLNQPFIRWQAGLSIEMAHSRWYGSRIEMSYVQKGAKELFAETNTQMESTTRLDYAQLVLLPIILKPGFRKVQPYIGAGGYVGYLVNAKHSLLINGREAYIGDRFYEYTNKIDYGWAVSTGCYLWRHPLEIRYEIGMANLFKPDQVPAKVGNQTLSINFSL